MPLLWRQFRGELMFYLFGLLLLIAMVANFFLFAVLGAAAALVAVIVTVLSHDYKTGYRTGQALILVAGAIALSHH